MEDSSLFQDRKNESHRLKELHHNNRIPVIVKTDDKLLQLSKSKFLVPLDMSLSKFLFVVRQRIKTKINEKEALFLIGMEQESMTMTKTVKKIPMLMNCSQLFSDIAPRCTDEDGFIYLSLCKEVTFGCC